MALHFHKLTVKDIRQETKDCVSIEFDIPKELEIDFLFKQGQNITIKTNMNGEEIRRSYSICSCPLDHELRIAVKKAYGGFFSTFANQKLKCGDLLEVLPPTGTFFTEVHISNKKEYVFFAAGSGITPEISIIKTILRIEPQSTVTLVYGNRNVPSIIFKEDLEALKDKYLQRFRIYHILSRERTEAAINYGRIDAEKCRHLSKLINLASVDDFFICGPEKMIFDIKEFLETHGINKKKIHFDKKYDLKTDDKIYCSEMIYKILKKVTNNRIAIAPSYVPENMQRLIFIYFKKYNFSKNVISSRKIIAIDNLYNNEHCKPIMKFALKDIPKNE